MAEANPSTALPEHLEPIHYQSPALNGRRGVVRLAKSETMVAMIQVLKPGGGEIELHSHGAMDGLWFVMRGKARFYGAGEEYIEIGPHQAVFVPKDAPYWFENSGDEELEILQVESIDPRIPNTYTRHKAGADIARMEMFEPDGTLIREVTVDRTEAHKTKLDDWYAAKKDKI